MYIYVCIYDDKYNFNKVFSPRQDMHKRWTLRNFLLVFRFFFFVKFRFPWTMIVCMITVKFAHEKWKWKQEKLPVISCN